MFFELLPQSGLIRGRGKQHDVRPYFTWAGRSRIDLDAFADSRVAVQVVVLTSAVMGLPLSDVPHPTSVVGPVRGSVTPASGGCAQHRSPTGQGTGANRKAVSQGQCGATVREYPRSMASKEGPHTWIRGKRFQSQAAFGNKRPKKTSGTCEQWSRFSILAHKLRPPASQTHTYPCTHTHFPSGPEARLRNKVHSTGSTKRQTPSTVIDVWSGPPAPSCRNQMQMQHPHAARMEGA